MKGRLLAISDIHGRYNEFIELMKYVKFDYDDTLVILGDMIDRGPDSAKVVNWLYTKQQQGVNIKCLMGNHELMFIQYLAGQLSESEYTAKFVGGKATLESYEYLQIDEFVKHINFIGNLPNYIEQDGYVFTHGGININKGLTEQTFNDTAWDDNKFYSTKGIKDKIVIFGHYPTNMLYKDINKKDIACSRIWKDPVYKNKIGIDCGNYSNKRLACLDLTNNLEYYYTFSSNDFEILKSA